MKKIITTKVVLGAIFAFLMTITSVQVFAQTTAAISGTVLDEKGEGLPGANVIAIHEPTGSRYGAATRADGRYNIVNMRPGGPYKVTISFVGYKDDVKTGVNLTLNQDQRINSKLETAEAQLEEVKVVASRSSVINAGRTGAATTVSNKQITTLPTLNRSLTDFARLDPRSNGSLSFAGRNALFNNLTVDGAFFNNAFGLNGTIGGQASAQPISVDAIDQFQVNIAPFDVRQGMSSGANINVVTKTGTNEWSGSVYGFNRNQDLVGDKIGSVENAVSNFKVSQIGGRIGGAIIKNKLFVFASFEKEDRIDPGTTFKPTRDGITTDNATSSVKAADLDRLRDFLKSKFNYDPGAYENYDRLTQSTKFNVRLDWNISDKHKFNIKYNNLRSFADIPPSNSGALPNGGGPSNTNLPFQGSYYRINNNLDSYIAELNSTFSGKIANNLTVGYTQLRDFREAPYNTTPFPTVHIGNGSGQAATTIGFEPFSVNNVLDTDVLQITDNLTIYSGKNVFTLGVAYENNEFRNGFAPDFYSLYQFRTFDDFYNSVNNGTSTASLFRNRWSIGSEFPFARMKGSTLSFYAQDEINLGKGFKLTVGLRADGTSFPVEQNATTNNERVNSLTFRDGVQVNTGKYPDFTLLWSPRVGFNWDVNEEKNTQVRGGFGIFTGRVPYVWLSNQLSNNGVLFGSESIAAAAAPAVVANRPFSNDVTKYKPTTIVLPTSYNLAITDENFKFPQIFRANLAVDRNLGNGWLATFEGIYTKDINAVYLDNINLPIAPRTAIGADNRPIYFNVGTNGFPSTRYNRIYGLVANGGTTLPANLSLASPDISDAILMKNTNNGYSYSLTGTISKTFENGLFASLSYTNTDSRSVNDGGSIAQSMWRDRVVSGDPNADVLSYSNFLQRHRIVAFGSYRLNYLNNKMATTFGFTYSVGPGQRFSYVYTGDLNGDGSGGNNDLIYIPRDQSEILLRAIPANAATGAPLYTVAQQWADLDAYIKQDSYLNSRRGQYAERNGGESPWAASFDFKVTQDFNFKVGGKINTIQLSLDMFNAGNYVSPNWGINQGPVRVALLNFAAYDNAAGAVATGSVPTGRPIFTFPYRAGANPLNETFQNGTGLGSRWQGQIGIRYIFN
jgi:Carboxypeptidase regulatory-like domain